MNNEFSSLVAVDAEKAKTAALKAINYVEDYRQQEWERQINKKMNRKIFPRRTREKAIEEIDEGSALVHPDNRLLRTMYDAKCIWKAAQLSVRDYIWLSLEDARFVYYWLKEEE